MANPVFGEGTVLEINDGAASAYVAVDDLTENLTPPNPEHPRVPRPRLSQTTFAEVVLSALKQLGESSFTYEMKYANFSRIALLVNVEKSFRITYPSEGTEQTRFAFTGKIYRNVANPITGGAITTATATLIVTSLITVTDNIP